jgi:hypothetical protein
MVYMLDSKIPPPGSAGLPKGIHKNIERTVVRAEDNNQRRKRDTRQKSHSKKNQENPMNEPNETGALIDIVA